MNPRFLWMLLMVVCASLGLSAQTTYSATFDNASAEAAVRILKKATGLDFVYQKQLLTDTDATVSGTYRNLKLEDLLDATVERQLSLAYKIVGNTVRSPRLKRPPMPSTPPSPAPSPTRRASRSLEPPCS